MASERSTATACDAAGRDVRVDRDRALAIAARDGLESRLLRDPDQLAEPDDFAARRPHEQASDVLGALTLVLQQPAADVEAPPLVLELRDADAADRGVHGLADGRHAHAEIGGAVAVGHDLGLGHSHLIVGVDVGDEARLPHLLGDLSGGGREHVPVAAPHVELDREASAARGAESGLRDVLEHDPAAGDRGGVPADDVHELELGQPPPELLVDGPLARGLHVDVGLPEIDVGAADASGEERDLGARHQERLDLPEVTVGRVEARPDRRLEADREAAHVLARDELLAQEADRDEREEKEGEAAQQQPGPVAQGRAERSQVERGQPPEKAVHRPAEAAPMLDLEESRAAHRREGERLEQREERRRPRS